MSKVTASRGSGRVAPRGSPGLPPDCEVVHKCGQGRAVLYLSCTGELWHLGKRYPLHPGRLALVCRRPNALRAACMHQLLPPGRLATMPVRSVRIEPGA